MMIKLLYCILIPIIRAPHPMRGLANMFSDWDESQLFIFYEPKPQRSSRFQNPDCFAFQLSPNYAFTTSSCFMNLERISKMLENHETHESIMDRIFSRNDMKSSIETFNVVQVFAKYFT